MHSPLGFLPPPPLSLCLHLYVRLFALLYNNPGVWRRRYWTYRLMVERWILLQERFWNIPVDIIMLNRPNQGRSEADDAAVTGGGKKKKKTSLPEVKSAQFVFFSAFHPEISRPLFFSFFLFSVFFLLSPPAKVLACFVCSCGDTTPEMWSNKSQSDSNCSLHTNVWTALVSR